MKIAALGTFAAGLLFASLGFASGNGWWPQQYVKSNFVIDTDVGPVCEFQLDDNTIWAFKVAGHEKVVDLVQTALLNNKTLYVNYNATGGTNSASRDFLDFTPIGAGPSRQHLSLSYGVSVNR